MKKLVVAILSLALALPAFAQGPTDNVATGTFGGSVGGMCVVRSNGNAYNGTLTPGNPDDDGFASTLSGSGDFSYRSNAPCTASSDATSVTGPGSFALVGDCDTAQPVLAAATANDPVNATVNASIRRQDFNVLLAGPYTLTCVTTLTAGAN